jgi:hypothetical protein
LTTFRIALAPRESAAAGDGEVAIEGGTVKNVPKTGRR